MDFVIIGPGYISRRYVEKIKAIKQANVVAVVGRDEDRTQQYAYKHDVPICGTDLKTIVRKAGPQAAIICTPNAYHHDTVLMAAELGLHCICEKPLDISRERQDEMVDKCRRRGVALAVSYIHRFHEHLRHIKSLIDSGALGDILVVDAAMKIFREPDYYAKSSWHGTTEIDGGGPFMQQGSHLIDLVLWLAGEYREILDAKRFNVFHDIEVEDHGYAVIRYKCGAVGMIEVSTACRGMNKNTIEIVGTRGHVIADFERIIRFEVEGSELPQWGAKADAFSQLITDFIESIALNRDPFVTGESAKAATELILDIYLKTGPVVKLH